MGDFIDGDIICDIDSDDDQNSYLSSMKNHLLKCVAKSDGFFKSQQVGEKDLTFEEKHEIASDLLDKNIPLFLQRYWKFINLEDVPFFDSLRSNYEVNFYVTEIIKYQNSRTKKVHVRNRRYEALKRMVKESSYFSDVEMKNRNPLLYDQMIGQHLTENERIAAYKKQHENDTFSMFLMDQMERNVETCLFNQQKDEDEAIEEDDDSSEEESELEDEEPVKIVISDQEKNLLRSEFTNIMYESFLAGKDKGFDYSAKLLKEVSSNSTVDDNAEYDSVQQQDIDEQDRYFDEDSSHTACDSDEMEEISVKNLTI